MEIDQKNIIKQSDSDEFAQKFSTSLLAWYTANKRDLPWRRTKDPYRIWVSEVMLQQTQVITVIPYYEKFLQRFPTISMLAEASEDEALKYWRGLGYYSRARHLWEGARYVTEHFGGLIPGDYNSLIKIPGVGIYTAGAVASIAFGQKVPAIDGNVKRVISRILAWREPVEKANSLKMFTSVLDRWQPQDKSGDFNQALMELGAMVCTPQKPNCNACPVIEQCKAFSIEEVSSFPVKLPKKRPKPVTRLTFILRKGNEVYLQQRPSQGMLAGMWEFPGVELEGAFLESEDPDRLKFSSLSKERWFSLYQQAVCDRSYDFQVRAQISQNPNLEGPLGYVFSHRRWQIYWLNIRVEEREALNGLNLLEKKSEYGVNRFPGIKACWLEMQNISDLSVPVAFDELVKTLKNTED